AIALTVLFGMVFGLAYFGLSQLSRNLALARVEEDLTITLEGGRKGVNTADLESLITELREAARARAETDGISLDEAYAAIAPEYENDPRYIRLMDWLTQINEIESRAWPYVYFPEDETNSFVAVGDLWNRTEFAADKAYPFLDYNISTKGIITQGFKQMTRHPDNRIMDEDGLGYDDDFGNDWMSAYAPIVDAGGTPIAAMGVDFRGEYVAEVTRAVQRQVLLYFGIGYLVFLIFVVGASFQFTQPIRRLASAAERIGEGDYQQDISGLSVGPGKDEISTLAEVFDIMIGKVYQREQTLKKQVQDLQIMIDEQKKAAQVAEIVESDFFRDLQSKARSMRKRASTTNRDNPVEE
ncbi:MAG: HAMP domain-containing protein, partial [Anaerolineae bacterium]|nr:HAMP domain-containing protein [Anaerolineae bacterium]